MKRLVARSRYLRTYALLAAAALSVGSVVVVSLLFSADPSRAVETIGFGKSVLQGETSDRPTSLQFGPDGRLYVSNQGVA